MCVTLAAGVTLAVCVAPAAADDLTLRIMTYNIYFGGQDHDPVFGRQHEWLRVIESRNPDVIVLEEANGWLPGELNLIAAYVDSLNQAFPLDPPYTGRVGDANSAFNVALLSRLPILQFDEYRVVQVQGETCTLRHVFIHAALAADGETVHVIGTHFRPGWDDREERELEARALLTILQGLPAGEKVWVLGDFNSYSPVDVQPGSPTAPLYQSGAPAAERYGWEPVGYLLDRGYRDAFRDRHPLTRGYTRETREFLPVPLGPIMRIDFILDSPGGPWALESAEVVADGWAEVGSDHYAVCATYRRPDWAAVPEAALPARGVRLLPGPNPLVLPGAVRYRLDEPAGVTAEVFAVDGRRVAVLADGWRAAGVHELRWERSAGAPVAEGTYYLRIAAGGSSSVAPLVVRRR